MIPPLAALDAASLQAFRDTVFPAIKGSMAYFGPELQVAAAAMAIFIFDVFIPRRFSKHLAWVALAVCITGSISVLSIYGTAPRELFLGSIAIDPFANFFKTTRL